MKRLYSLPRSSERGLTLVELLVTVAVIVIVMAIAIPVVYNVTAGVQSDACNVSTQQNAQFSDQYFGALGANSSSDSTYTYAVYQGMTLAKIHSLPSNCTSGGNSGGGNGGGGNTPPNPGNLIVTPGNGTITLVYDPPPITPLPSIDYQITIDDGVHTPNTITTTNTSTTITDMTNETTYTITVKACVNGTCSTGATISATPSKVINASVNTTFSVPQDPYAQIPWWWNNGDPYNNVIFTLESADPSKCVTFYGRCHGGGTPGLKLHETANFSMTIWAQTPGTTHVYEGGYPIACVAGISSPSFNFGWFDSAWVKDTLTAAGCTGDIDHWELGIYNTRTQELVARVRMN